MTPGHAANAIVSPESRCSLQQRGVTLSADATRLSRSESCSARLRRQLSELAHTDTPVALRVLGLGGGDAVYRFYETCRELREACLRVGVNARSLELTIKAGSIPLPAAWHVRRTLLGNGVLNIMFDADSPGGGASPDFGRGFWRDLWRLRSARVRSAFWPTVRSTCALLSPESGTGVVPGCGLQAPEQSAWMRGEFELGAYADDGGNVDMAALAAALARFMDAADRAYDTVSWPTPAMQHDAWYNRRLAIVIGGIGDIARLRDLDPERHDSLTELRTLLADVRRIVETQSRASALHQEQLPAITASNPCLHVPSGSLDSCWQRRWHAALERHALRHRNLLVMSPWSLFPSDGADYRYANLLPLLVQADACEFRRPVSLDAWTVRQMKLFHCRAWALNNAALSSAVVADWP